VLLDYHLSKLGISPEQVSGYTQEEYTHLNVAAAVAAGRADCGFGIPAAAQALGLEFIPLFFERYQLIVPRTYADSPLLQPLWRILQDERFHQAVLQLPGYQLDAIGEILAEVP
jgi:putative molybdopterin biosynthesis protein